MRPKRVTIKKGVLSIFLLLIAAAIWNLYELPTSIDEAIFRYQLSARAVSGSANIKLAELMPGGWELVCDSHGYDGDLYLARYRKTYPPAAPPQDGVWGLLFVSSDGSAKYAVGTCRLDGVRIDVRGCAARDASVLMLRENRGRDCREYARLE
ncbi:hypothetical protein [Noviherbaspirillum cavernae]|uniref:hypothetical protein n=1 Tax=Noviherbaspirillum cavernae TaxID=2320862 RepID=UPI0011C36C86|nr:hypothetical protein [Noviherbaspirillum cavernae]